jgi:hypothetical protein
MNAFHIRSLGQLAVFAGIWQTIFVPFFTIGALGNTGYSDALRQSIETSTYAPLVDWASQYPVLLVITALVQSFPTVIIIKLPITLKRVVHGETGAIGQWIGIVGIIITAFIFFLNAVIFFGIGQQYSGADSATRSILGSNYRIIAITLSLIVNVIGGLLIAIWLWTINFAVAHLPGYERIVGIVGLISSALFASTAALIAWSPQQPHQIFTGTSLAFFGIWLTLTGYLLIKRAPALDESL